MKIAFLNIYQSSVNRGAETFVRELSSRLESHSVDILSQESKKLDWSKKDMVGTFRRRFFIDYWSRAVFIFTLKNLKKIYKAKYDVVIAVNGGWQTLLVRIVTALYGGKLVVSGQSGIGWDDRINLYCFPNVFIALTDYQKSWAKKINPFVKVEKIPNGVDLVAFSKSKSNTPKLPRPIILCVAALVDWKRLDLAIRAVAKLKKGTLVLVGEGEREQELKTLARECGLKNLQVFSSNPEKMSLVYKSADVFTYPTSPAESFGIVLVEALASNLPIVATDDPIRREIVGEAGVFVDPTDLKAYTWALKKALEMDWGNKPRLQAEKFSWDNIAILYANLFESLK